MISLEKIKKINIPWKEIANWCIVIILCITVFLFAKYIVRRDIGWETPPIDVSERM